MQQGPSHAVTPPQNGTLRPSFTLALIEHEAIVGHRLHVEEVFRSRNKRGCSAHPKSCTSQPFTDNNGGVWWGLKLGKTRNTQTKQPGQGSGLIRDVVNDLPFWASALKDQPLCTLCFGHSLRRRPVIEHSKPLRLTTPSVRT